MFWRHQKDGSLRPLDLSGSYADAPLFLIGGSPSLAQEQLGILSQRGVVTMAMNNAAVAVRPHLWVGADRPECFARQILQDPGIMKFINWTRREMLVEGVPWQTLPSTLIYECAPTFESYNFTNYLDAGPKFVWWKNTFFIAFQLAWRLGFRRIYLVGVDFKITEENETYAWPSVLEKEEVEANRVLYGKSVEWLGSMQGLFARNGLVVKNCSSGSALRPAWGFTPLEVAVRDECRAMETPVDTRTLPHSMRGKLKATAKEEKK